MMTRRCAVYARFSSDLQRDSSIEDQIRKCKEFAKRKGWTVVESFIYCDKAVSGGSMYGRDALQRLMADAKIRPSLFDCVLIDDTSRFARDVEDSLRNIRTLKFYEVDVVSVSQGIDTADKSSKTSWVFSAMMDEQYVDGLRDKVHRGQEGRVLQGMNPGGRCYGYRNVPIEDPTRKAKYGRQAVLSVRQEINEAEAAVVRRIFQMYADGIGLATIATSLNAEGVLSPVPTQGRPQQWSRYTIYAMLRNEKYHGVVVWNRTQKGRDPETRRKVSKKRPESEWRRIDVSKLRIVPEELWTAVQKRNADTKKTGIARMGGLCRTRKSRSYLFSGLLGCGVCNQSVVIVSGGGKRGYVKYGCHSHKHRGTCDSNLTIRRERLEDQLLAVIEQRILKPEIIDYVIRRCDDEVRRRFKEMERDGTFRSACTAAGRTACRTWRSRRPGRPRWRRRRPGWRTGTAAAPVPPPAAPPARSPRPRRPRRCPGR